MASTIRYKFSQKFNFPARRAYRWLVDYDSEDLSLMGDVGRRSIEKISIDKVILDDTYYKGKNRIRKRKFVQLYPDRMMWVSTHLIGPTMYSQFFYEIFPEGKNASRLDFTGMQTDHGRNKSAQQIAQLATKLRTVDSGAWKKLAKEMEKDLG